MAGASADGSAAIALLAAVAGLLLSLGIEAAMHARPLPIWKRPRASAALHGGLWLIAYCLLLLLLGRPWFAAATVSAFMLLLVLVNNAKVKSLRESFVFQDFEYFTDAIRHPRLYLPFLGWGRALAAVAGFALAVAAGLWLEGVPPERFVWAGQGGVLAGMAVLAGVLLALGHRTTTVVAFDAESDTRRLGLLAALWRYAHAERVRPDPISPFAVSRECPDVSTLPHLVAVQSESFFDPRPHFPGIRPEILACYDELKAAAVAHGRLTVPAWGANTVRTEFAFLSGLSEQHLGVHRFNPYRTIADWPVPTLATYLKRLGYRTVCVHPYPASFYRRDRVYPALGFDAFMDIREFAGAERCGPYIGDVAVAEKIRDLLDRSSEPVFVYAITMENHGPLHLESVTERDVAELHTQPPPAGCADLTVYLRHVRNADRMLAQVKQALEENPRGGSICWYGDHVPIMSSVYERLGVPDGRTDYLIWTTAGRQGGQTDLAVEELGMMLAELAGRAPAAPNPAYVYTTQA